MSLPGKNDIFLPLPFAQEMSFFSAFLRIHGFNNGSKNSSVVGGAVRDVTTRTYIGISVDGTVKLVWPRTVLSRTARELARKSFRITVVIAVD